MAEQLIEQLEKCMRDFRGAQRFSGVVVGGGGTGGRGGEGWRFLRGNQKPYTLQVYTVSVVSICLLCLRIISCDVA